MKNIGFIILFILIVFVAIQGYLVFVKFSRSSTNNSPSQTTQANLSPEPINKPNPTNTSVLVVPNANSTQAEKNAFSTQATQMAKRADYLDISNCAPNPQVLTVNFGSSINVKNNDKVTHTLVINPQETYDILANSTKTITINFQHGPGFYGYGCDKLPNSVGVFSVLKK